MAHLEFKPSSLTDQAVQCLWWHAEEHGVRRTLLPDSFIELCFQSGAAKLSNRALPNVYVLGLQTEPLELMSSGALRVLGVRFHGWAGLRILGLEPPLSGFQTGIGATLLELADAVLPHVRDGDPAAALAILEPWLKERAVEDNALHRAGRRLTDSVGAMRIAALAAMLGVSQRQLERVFRDETGVAPKRLARLIRFQHASRRLHDEPDANLAALAMELGFADQAHFNREFRSFSRVTPTEFASNLCKTASSAQR